ncbi:hypothetical protein VF14_32650 [Nostoc linckia z18]|uniref:Uncharacterized protein n=2 Tax=Nostoc linckia TaxID=92942 RepID=A0A9Q5Z7L1_NOSLI|nr:hypothetical protein [Nostoc linckia]PHK33596.1 hypothetical protein VF12_25075 [Nostoc linckia z15]PHK44578.1 hypothetical protein VF13_21485 [Nostoc linckia z16]PHJ59622.1 hypothetical protein VF02_24760 [Nostoc linckia z1]PHJ59914.1 hypothetical protein VF03_33990 [Nostoc linckia z2]PHJ65100.1 hypothetical protein VF05_21390 [Nostoc linckia z3]
MSYWREKAAAAIEEAIALFAADLNNLNDQQKQRLKCAIDASYPFGLRKNHPYQAWLDERRKAFYRLGLAEAQMGSKGAKRKPAIGCDSTVPGQQSLF